MRNDGDGAAGGTHEAVLARIRALLRRTPLPYRPTILVGDLVVDRGARSVRVAGLEVPLGATEFRLLEYLAANAGLALTRVQILGRVWGEDFDGSSNVVDVYVSAVRRKLAAAGEDTENLRAACRGRANLAADQHGDVDGRATVREHACHR